MQKHGMLLLSWDSITKLDFRVRYPNNTMFTWNHICWYLNGTLSSTDQCKHVSVFGFAATEIDFELIYFVKLILAKIELNVK